MSLVSKISALALRIATEFNSLRSQKQDALVSGTNIKTVNGESLLGSGDIEVQGGGGGGLGEPIAVVPTNGLHVIDASLSRYFKLNIAEYTQQLQQQATITRINGVSNNLGSNTSTSLTPSATGMQAGDLILMFVSSYGSMANIPTGYTEIARITSGNTRLMACYKFATGPTESSVNVTGFSTSTVSSWQIFRGVDPTTPFDATRTTATGTSGMPNPPSLTYTSQNNMMLAVGSIAAAPSGVTAPSTFTLTTSVTSSTNQGFMLATRLISTVGSTDPPAFGASVNNSAAWVGMTIALRAKWETIVNELDTYVLITNTPNNEVYEAILEIECTSNKVIFPYEWSWNYPVNFKLNSGMQVRIISDNGGTTFKAFAPVTKNAFAPVLLEEYTKDLTIPAMDINWKAGAIFYKTLSSYSQLTFSNLEQGKVITAIISGNGYPLSLNSACRIISGEFKSYEANYIQFICVSPTLVLTTISQQKT